MRPQATVLASLVALLTLVGCERAEPTAAPVGSSERRISVAGEDRSYRLYVPAHRADPAPLVVMLHGGFGTAKQAEEAYGWNAAAERDGFVVAYPDGHGRAWSVGGGCCGEPGRDGTDDVGFITAVVADVARLVPLDQGRVFATGMSNGAMMSYRLACDSTVFAAIAPVAGVLLGDCPTPHPVSVLHIHGLADSNVPYDGSPGNGAARIDGPDIPSTVDRWRIGCSPKETVTDGAVTTARSECPDGRAVVLVTIAGAGHQWPGSDRTLVQRAIGLDPPSDAVDATMMISQFFMNTATVR